MPDDKPVGWAERRVREAVELAFDGVSIEGVVISSRMFRFVPPRIDVTVQLLPEVRGIDITVDIKFDEEA